MASDELLVVGLGASAGGIKAIRAFFEQVPPNSGIAFVVILHLSPDHDSHLAEVLQLSAKIPVIQVRKQTGVEVNHVYVIPPNQSLSMLDGFLNVSEITRIEERRAPVDVFFRTLAESRGARAACVVLSGTGANGSMGMKRIKECGGICLVQDPEEAEYGDMPRNSIATGLVDYVLPAAEIPAKIIAYRDGLTSPRATAPSGRPQVDESALRDVLAQLFTRTGHDFSNYKPATVMRRIERRIAVHELPDLPAYARFMRDRPQEADALLKDLLISVTNFFRDRSAFDEVERRLIIRLFDRKRENDPVRVWVAGCATGEEAYSIAMLLAEHKSTTPAASRVQIFATDIDERSIAAAREGLYTLNDAADVPADRLRRFFTKEGEEYRVRKELREMILFARHNVIKDPPFSHLDLVSCRNLLIYLNRAAQRRVLEVAHFALNPGGYLFLGSSESVEGASDLFVALDKEAHLFQSRDVASRLGLLLPDLHRTARADAPPAGDGQAPARVHERPSPADLHYRLLEQYGSPSIVVDDEHEIVHLSERAGQYLQFSGGDPSHNVLKVVRPELRLELRTALYQAAHERTSVETSGLAVRVDDKIVVVNLVVRPVPAADAGQGYFLILFEEVVAGTEIGAAADATPVRQHDAARQLEDEIQRVKEVLRGTIERHEAQADDLKASNEELLAINEELRSAGEELETSKEELQSLNEELRTVNQELRIKIEEQSQVNDDINNLMNSTEIGAIFLDRAYRIKLFTPRARDIFSLIPADRGRLLSDISNTLVETDLHAEVDRVLDDLTRVEREVVTRSGDWHAMRILPYRTTDDRIEGVVLTFQDITDRKRADGELRALKDGLEIRVQDRTSELAAANRSLDQQLHERRQAEERIRRLLSRLMTVQEDERRRIARDLHDHLGQQVAGLRLKLESLDHPARGDRDRTVIEDAQQIIARLDRDLDFFTWELRPAALDDLGLVVTLGNYVQEWSKNFGIPADFHSSGLDDGRLDLDTETALYRIAQEALNNTYKHARASRAGVILERRGDQAVLIIEDNGQGFVRHDGKTPPQDKGIGLLGMRERAALVGGTLEIESVPGAGTTVFARVPLVLARDPQADGP